MKGFRTILFNTAIWPPLLVAAKALLPQYSATVDAVGGLIIALGNVWLRFNTDTAVGKSS